MGAGASSAEKSRSESRQQKVETGTQEVKEKLGIGLGNKANNLIGRDQDFYGSEASAATNEYLESIGEAKVSSYFVQQGGEFKRVSATEYNRLKNAGAKVSKSYQLTSEGKKMKYGSSGGAMGYGDPSGIMTSVEISEPMFEQQRKIQMIGLGAASLATGGLAGAVFRLGAGAAYTSSYGAYRQKFQARQGGTMSSPAITGTTTAEGDTSYTAPTTSVGGTGITGETGTKFKSKKASSFLGKGAPLRTFFN
jgi:hypothetical protein